MPKLAHYLPMKTKIVNRSARDKYIIEKSKEGFSFAEIQILLPKEGFKKVSRSRVGQIVQKSES